MAEDKPLSKNVTLKGISVSRGYAAGLVFVYRPNAYSVVREYEVTLQQVPAELARYNAAREICRVQIEALVESLSKENQKASEIFQNHLMILDDIQIVEECNRRITHDHLNAEAAIRRTTEKYREIFGRIKDPYLRERIRDVDDIERRILGVLQTSVTNRDIDNKQVIKYGFRQNPWETFSKFSKGEESQQITHNAFANVSHPVVVVAEDLTPSETVALPKKLVLGFALNAGSATSHVALLARALGIPAVVGLGDIVSKVKVGDEVLLNGTSGEITINPDVRTCAEFARLVHNDNLLLTLIDEGRAYESTTKDGEVIRFCANAQPGISYGDFAKFGAQGVGLYRSEYLWLAGNKAPSEETQFAAYTKVVEAVKTLGDEARVVFRVLDIGGDKLVKGVSEAEANPFLGCRSIRWLLSHKATFRTQLRAILRASNFGKAAIMWPMVSTVQEIRDAKVVLKEVMAELQAQGIPYDEHILVGCMIEVPAAALCAEVLAKEVDFFSIGTNDLVQYTFAADRGNASVAYLYQPAHLAVMRLVEMTVKAAKQAGIPVAVCGETASDPVLGLLWIGMGVNELSMSASYIPVLRKVVRALTGDEIRGMVTLAKTLAVDHTATEVYNACRSYVLERVPQLEELQSFFTAV